MGPNSSGKSSIFDAILLIAQSELARIDVEDRSPNWAGPLVDLGSFRDSVFRHDMALPIEIELGFHMDETGLPWRSGRMSKSHKGQAIFSYSFKGSPHDQIGKLSRLAIRDPRTSAEVSFRYHRDGMHARFLNQTRIWRPRGVRRRGRFEEWFSSFLSTAIKSSRISSAEKRAYRWLMKSTDTMSFNFFSFSTQRVSSGRSAPRRWYPATDPRVQMESAFPKVYDSVDASAIVQRRDDPYADFLEKSQTGRHRSLRSVLRDLEIATDIRERKLSPYHTSIDIVDSITNVRSNLIDVGYGASQAIPVLQAALSYSVGPLFIEQPEIHLHPRAQGALANILCETSRHRQVVIETHSVHMINRARILIAKGKLPPGNVMVLYVKRGRKGSRVRAIPILDNGDFGAPWPEGFFDERYEDTMQLLSLKGDVGI